MTHAPFRRVLCATDFSETSEVALTWASRFARTAGAELHVVHAWQVPQIVSPAGAYLASAEVVASVRAELAGALDKACLGHEVTSKRLVEGLPDHEVVRTAADVGADLVVVGTHGRTGVAHVLLGSVAERIVRTSPVAVVTVPLAWKDALASHAGKALVSRVLVPTDLTSVGDRALARLLPLAEWLGAEVDLLHVLDLPPYALAHTDLLGDLERGVRGDLADLAGRHATSATAVHTEVRVGIASETIVAVAREKGADLVALATHGRTGIPRFFLGSVAERVARMAHLPVLTLRIPE